MKKNRTSFSFVLFSAFGCFDVIYAIYLCSDNGVINVLFLLLFYFSLFDFLYFDIDVTTWIFYFFDGNIQYFDGNRL